MLTIKIRLWEGSWADDAISPDPENDSYADPDKIRTIKHDGKYFHLNTRHIVDPSPQRTPFLFQAGTSGAGSEFASAHAEGIFVSSHSPKVLRPKVQKIRDLAAEKGRDPQAKYEELLKYASVVGSLVLVSGWTGIDLSKVPLDKELTADDSLEPNKVRSVLEIFTTKAEDVPRWTPRTVAEKASIGGLGHMAVGSPQTVADDMERVSCSYIFTLPLKFRARTTGSYTQALVPFLWNMNNNHLLPKPPFPSS